MKKILVPTDFSECSYHAITYASEIARITNAELYLLHIIEVPEMSSMLPISNEWMYADQGNRSEVHFMMSMMEEAKKRMETYRERIELSGLEIVENIEVGVTEEVINTAASRYGIDLIVICAYGSGGDNDFFIGSNAEKVLHHTSKPVITVKNTPLNLPKNIVFASDFSAEAATAFPVIRNFASIFNAKIHLLKVNTLENFETTRESRQRVDEFLGKTGLTDYDFTVYNDLMIEPGIINFSRDINADLIALATHERHGLTHIFVNSLSEDLVTHAQCPVMTVNISAHP